MRTLLSVPRAGSAESVRRRPGCDPGQQRTAARIESRCASPGVKPARREAGRKGLGGSHLDRARALGARLDLELDVLATGESVEVEGRVEAAAVEEVFLTILGDDETEAAIRDYFLYGTCGHY